MTPSQRIVIFQVVPISEAGFSARAALHPIFIQGDTIDELRQNADDAVRCHFGNTRPQPKIMLHFDDEESRPA